MIIDFHAHVFPDRIAHSAMKKLSEEEGAVAHYLDGTAKDLRESMLRAKIDKSVILNIATRPGQEKSILQFSIELQSSVDLIPFGSVHPDSNAALEFIDRAAQAGIRGLKIHPQYQGIALDDPRYEKIARAAAEAGMIMLSHTGYDPAYPRERVADAKRILRLISRVPDLKFVAAHFGGFDDWDEVNILAGTGVWMDTSFMCHFLEPQRIADMIIIHGEDRVVFGTDSPWTDQYREVQKMLSIPLSDTIKEKVMYKNAVSLLNLK